MNKSAFVGTVGSNTICQKTQEESCPQVHWVIGRQTVPESDPELACELAPAPLGGSLGAPEEHWHQQFPTCKRDFVEIQHSVKFSKLLEQKYLRSDSFERIRRIAWLQMHHPLPHAAKGPNQLRVNAWDLGFLQLYGMLPKRTVSLATKLEYWVVRAA